MTQQSHVNPVTTPAWWPIAVRRPEGNVRRPSISWGAVIAGLFMTLALGWLLQLLGAAIGVSVADWTNSATLGGTLGISVTLWVVISWLFSFFIGSLVTARLAGRIDDVSGMLHGLTLWAVSTVCCVALGYYGVSMIASAGQSLFSGVVGGVSSVASGASSTASGTASLAETVADEYGDEIQTVVYDRAIEMTAANTEGLTNSELRSAVNSLDQRTMRRLMTDLTNNDSEGAAEIIAEQTQLSQSESRSLVDTAYSAIEEQVGNPDNNQSLTTELKRKLVSGVDSYIAKMDQQGGPDVSQGDIRRALNDMDADAMQSLTFNLIEGDFDGAKHVVTRNTNLTKAEVNELIDGTEATINQQVEEYKSEMNEVLEEASTYASQFLFTLFGSAAAALLVSVGGGYLGADSSRRIYGEEEEIEVRESSTSTEN